MPTYEYRCPKGHDFELFQRMSDDPRASCPFCGLESERLLSGGAGFLFKGDGFYITDYRSESYKKAASQEGSDSSLEKTGSGEPEKSVDAPAKKSKAEGSGSNSPSNGGSSTKGS